MTPEEAERLQRGLAVWAEREPSCRALALSGSWARGVEREGSDLDLIALVQGLDRWTPNAGWLCEVLARLGFVVETVALEIYGAARSWRVSLGSGAELELTLVESNWASVSPIDPGTRRVVTDGIRPLVDKDGLLIALEEKAGPRS